ncbi:Uncharacterised protein [Yersinia intermedia]|nr:Uncharacterised protein [Yersinia intermedia]VDZ59726.1 Uncharacterised protein [Yersinia intermedia]
MEYNKKNAIYNVVSLFITILISFWSSVSIINNKNMFDIILVLVFFFGTRAIIKFACDVMNK